MTCTIISERICTEDQKPVLKKKLSGLIMSLYEQKYRKFYVSVLNEIGFLCAEAVAEAGKGLPIRLYIGQLDEYNTIGWYRHHFMDPYQSLLEFFIRSDDILSPAKQGAKRPDKPIIYIPGDSSAVIVIGTEGECAEALKTLREDIPVKYFDII